MKMGISPWVNRNSYMQWGPGSKGSHFIRGIFGGKASPFLLTTRKITKCILSFRVECISWDPSGADILVNLE